MSPSYKDYPPTYPDPADAVEIAAVDVYDPPTEPIQAHWAEWADRPDLANYPAACTFAAAAPAAEIATRTAARQMFQYSRLRKAQVQAIYRKP